MVDQKISVSLKELIKENNENVTYNELVNIVNSMEQNIAMEQNTDMEDFSALEVHYQTNFIKSQLEKIADYYNISKRKKKKDELIQDIVIFEIDPNNIEIVFRRKKLWAYMKEIKEDRYLSKFLIFN